MPRDIPPRSDMLGCFGIFFVVCFTLGLATVIAVIWAIYEVVVNMVMH